MINVVKAKFVVTSNFTLMLLFIFSLVSTSHVHATPNTLNVYILKTMSLALIDDSARYYQQELRASMPNSNIVFTIDNAEGDIESARKMIQNRVAGEQKFDLFVSIATVATKAMVQLSASHQIPMQFMIVSEPADIGIVDEIGNVSKINMTGISHVISSAKKLSLFERVLNSQAEPKKLTIGLLYSDYPSSLSDKNNLMKVIHNYESIEFLPIKYPFTSGAGSLPANRAAIIAELDKVKDEIDGYWIPPGPAAHDPQLYDMIHSTLSLPQLFSESLLNVKKGALFGVFCDSLIIARSGAKISKSILKGTAPKQIAVNRSDVFIVAVNVSSALALNLVFPSSLLLLANEHIYR